MTKKEMKEKLAYELYELKERRYEIAEDLRQAKEEKNEDLIARYTRWNSKTYARIDQTKKIAEMFGLKWQEIDNMAFNISVQEATKAL